MKYTVRFQAVGTLEVEADDDLGAEKAVENMPMEEIAKGISDVIVFEALAPGEKSEAEALDEIPFPE